MTQGHPQGEPEGERGITPQGEGLSVRDAAHRLGVSEKVIRARISRGELDAWKINTRFGEQWRVRLPGGEPQGYPHVSEGYPQRLEGELVTEEGERKGEPGGEPRDNPGEVSFPPDAWQDFLHRHEAAVQQLGYFQAQAEQSKMLAASNEEMRERIARAEAQAQLAEEERQKVAQRAEEEHQARRKAEEEAERLRTELNATKGALESEREKGFWARLFGG